MPYQVQQLEPQKATDMVDVFISYSRKDIEFAQRLHHELEARDHKSCQSVEGTRPRDTPAFSAMANGQIKAAGTADNSTVRRL